MIQPKPNKKLVKQLLRRQRKARCWLNRNTMQCTELQLVHLLLNPRKKRKILYKHYESNQKHISV